MEENKIEEKVRSEPEKPKTELTHEQRQRQKKMLFYSVLFLIFAAAMWLIFAPSATDKQQEQGYNTNIPDPSNKQMTDDKKSAYEQAKLEEKQQERIRSMDDFEKMFDQRSDEERLEQQIRMAPVPPDYEEQRAYSQGRGGGSFKSSNAAYNDLNRQLGNFYEQPKEDPEKEEMRLKLEELNARLEQAEATPRNAVDDQIALMEKSYELAAKYLPSGQGGAGQAGQSASSATEPETKLTETVRNGKALMTPIGQVREQIVSGLSQPISDAEFIADYSQERNMGFHTAVGTEGQTEKNTIRACIHDNQTITDGQAVRMRLLEPMRAGTTILPRNAMVTGVGKISGERLGISITSLEYKGLIIPVELTVYDSDAQEGIFIPGSMEINAAKELAANMGSSLGTSVSITNQSAGDQLLTELGKGAIQGTSQYVSKKMRIVKVHFKAGYNVMLYQNKN